MGARILVADDSVTIQKVVELTFSKEEFVLVQAKSGEEAIRLALEERPDLILLDILMPDKDGYEVCAALRAHPALRDVPIILLTGTFEVFDKEKAAKAGANDFVTKPFESKSLIGKVKQFIEASGAAAPADSIPAASAIPELSLAGTEDFGKPISAPTQPALSTPSLEISQDQLWQLLETPVSPPGAASSALDLSLDSLEPAPAAAEIPMPEVAALDLERVPAAPVAPSTADIVPADLTLEQMLPEMATLDLDEIRPPAAVEAPVERAEAGVPALDLSLESPPDLSVVPSAPDVPSLAEVEAPPLEPAEAQRFDDLSLDDLLAGATEAMPPPASSDESAVPESVFDLTASLEAPSLPLVEAGKGEPPSLSMEDLLGPMETVGGAAGGAERLPELPEMELLSAEPPAGVAVSPDAAEAVEPLDALGLDLDLAEMAEAPIPLESAEPEEASIGMGAAREEVALDTAAVPPPDAAEAAGDREETPSLDLASASAEPSQAPLPLTPVAPLEAPQEEPAAKLKPGPAVSPDLAGLREAVTERVARELARELSEKLMARVEKVIWEVVPDLAEVLITQEIERIRRMAEEQKSA